MNDSQKLEYQVQINIHSITDKHNTSLHMDLHSEQIQHSEAITGGVKVMQTGMKLWPTCDPIVNLPIIAGFIDQIVIHVQLLRSQLLQITRSKCAGKEQKTSTLRVIQSKDV